jgi:hypothetical protein
VGVTVQGEHDGLEEDRSDPEGRGAHGPARPDVRSSGERTLCAATPGSSRPRTSSKRGARRQMMHRIRACSHGSARL